MKDFTKRWKEKTECSEGYKTTDCKNGPKATPTPRPPPQDPPQQVRPQQQAPAPVKPTTTQADPTGQAFAKRRPRAAFG